MQIGHGLNFIMLQSRKYAALAGRYIAQAGKLHNTKFHFHCCGACVKSFLSTWQLSEQVGSLPGLVTGPSQS